MHSALLALRPLSALRSLSLVAPMHLMDRFLQNLGCFTGLQRLQLQPSKSEAHGSLSLPMHRPRGEATSDAASAAAAAGADHLTQLEFNCVGCLPHISAWPHLQELLLDSVLPSSINSERVALLAAAPALRRLAFSYGLASPNLRSLDSTSEGKAKRKQVERMQKLQHALPGVSVERYSGSTARLRAM
ncbi:Cyanophycin synthase [Chlorella sorokiniana]|uniref:Cyanophycin synthase n=1 Tax=Chlorella sorokiniana TaxID=3076 RepID=A0A2P6TGF7_CHLSO|nr:Cyanophycin synthase [Chlorella sorokiniana]|eukprot:PRW33199.1 Cyanophycin synthase [Chlorella sorokiniana]